MTDFAQRRTMMVDTQVRPSDVTKFPIIEALLAIPREEYVPETSKEAAYVGDNLPVSEGRVMVEPRTLAKMLEALVLTPEDMVLNIGACMGYSAAVMARQAEAVIAVEEDEDMAKEAEQILAAQGVDNVALVQAPLTEGAAKHGPYDAILIEGAVEQISDALIAQLKDGGRIAALFLDGALGVVKVGYKLDGTVSWRFVFNASAPVLPGFEKEEQFAL
ncbi:MAG: protein-L-isoaspartate O-methyltransferase family protein [Mangrovicoccus sp.]